MRRFPRSRSASGRRPSPPRRSPAGRRRGASRRFSAAIRGGRSGLPDEGGRTTVMHGSGGKQTMLLPAPWNARTRVHEYGGLSYLPIPRSALAGQASRQGRARLRAAVRQLRRPAALPGRAGRSRRQGSADAADTGSGRDQRRGVGLTALARWRPVVCGMRTLCCRRTARRSGACRNGTRTARSAGPSWPFRWMAPPPTSPRRSASWSTGSDFFAFPTPSPDGNWLAWICWNHPHMPWDGTELRVAPVEKGMPGKGRLLMGSQRESVLAPLWRDNANLYVATDWPGWWNIYQLGLTGEPPTGAVPGRRGVRRAALAAGRQAVRAAG